LQDDVKQEAIDCCMDFYIAASGLEAIWRLLRLTEGNGENLPSSVPSGTGASK